MAGFSNLSGSGLSADLEGNAAATLSLTSSAAATAVLVEGLYAVWATALSYIAVGTAPTTVTAVNGYPILASAAPVLVRVRAGSKIGGITATTATLSYHKVG